MGGALLLIIVAYLVLSCVRKSASRTDLGITVAMAQRSNLHKQASLARPATAAAAVAHGRPQVIAGLSSRGLAASEQPRGMRVVVDSAATGSLMPPEFAMGSSSSPGTPVPASPVNANRGSPQMDTADVAVEEPQRAQLQHQDSAGSIVELPPHWSAYESAEGVSRLPPLRPRDCLLTTARRLRLLWVPARFRARAPR